MAGAFKTQPLMAVRFFPLPKRKGSISERPENAFVDRVYNEPVKTKIYDAAAS